MHTAEDNALPFSLRGPMRRIALLGSAGAGKSTLARELGETLGLPVVHLDVLYQGGWRPGWAEVPEEEWRALHEEAVRGEAWIIDGNYRQTFDTRLPRADTIVFMDLPRWLCLWRVLWRRVRYAGRSQPGTAPGHPVKVDRAFLTWFWMWHRHRRPLLLAAVRQYAGEKNVVILRRPRDVRRFVEQAGRQADAARAGGRP